MPVVAYPGQLPPALELTLNYIVRDWISADEEDRTQELELNLSGLLRGATTSTALSSSPVEDSLVEDRTVELEAALSDLVAGTTSSPSGACQEMCLRKFFIV